MKVQCPQPTPMVTLLTVREERAPDVVRAEKTETQPAVAISTYRDLFGNICERFVAPAGDFSIRSGGVIADSGLADPVDWSAPEEPVADLPPSCLGFLLPSRYCESDALSQVAWDLFGQVQPGWARVQAVCDFVHVHITFGYPDANVYRTAIGAWEGRIGVCRDYAHLAIAFLRALNIPARYVNGHLGDIGVPIQHPMDFSAWIEVWLGGRWRTFDPRNNRPRIGRIPVAYGRDAADTPLLHSFGPHTLTSFRVWTEEVEQGDSPPADPHPGQPAPAPS